MNNKTIKNLSSNNNFCISWEIPISNQVKEQIVNYLNLIDYLENNTVTLEFNGASDMRLDEATEIIKLCNEEVYCNFLVGVNNKMKANSRMLNVTPSFEKNAQKVTSIKLIK